MTDEFEKTQEVNAGAAQEAANSEVQAAEEQEHFDAEYVRKLRAEAAEYRKKLRELEARVKSEEEAKMTEQERLQKRLSELERREIEYQQSLQARTLEYEIKLHAAKLGIRDPEDAYKLIDFSQVEFDDEGRPSNLERLLRELIAKKPYLTALQTVSATNPAQGRVSGQQIFTRSQLRDPKFFEANRDAILQAMREGRIINE